MVPLLPKVQKVLNYLSALVPNNKSYLLLLGLFSVIYGQKTLEISKAGLRNLWCMQMHTRVSGRGINWLILVKNKLGKFLVIDQCLSVSSNVGYYRFYQSAYRTPNHYSTTVLLYSKDIKSCSFRTKCPQKLMILHQNLQHFP